MQSDQVVPPHRTTEQTRLWVQEHCWLHDLFKSPLNTFPKFRFPDLLGACVSLALSTPQTQRLLVSFLATELALRTPKGEFRSCDIWSAQFDQLMSARGAPWNRFPNPMFELEHIASACVAVASRQPFGPQAVLDRARENFVQRSRAQHPAN